MRSVASYFGKFEEYLVIFFHWKIKIIVANILKDWDSLHPMCRFCYEMGSVWAKD